MIAIIDNYDSFTYNLVQMLGEMGGEPLVLRNDAFALDELVRLGPRAVVISPGPGKPEEAGLSVEVIRRFAGVVPVLGICLGHQAIGSVFGGEIVRAPEPVHGKLSQVFHNNDLLFSGVANPFPAGRYHSLVVRRESLPRCLEVVAQTADGLVMGLRHRIAPVFGLQFHPESVITPDGRTILKNFLKGVVT